jgi:hypothetical protein
MGCLDAVCATVDWRDFSFSSSICPEMGCLSQQDGMGKKEDASWMRAESFQPRSRGDATFIFCWLTWCEDVHSSRLYNVRQVLYDTLIVQLRIF